MTKEQLTRLVETETAKAIATALADPSVTAMMAKAATGRKPAVSQVVRGGIIRKIETAGNVPRSTGPEPLAVGDQMQVDPEIARQISVYLTCTLLAESRGASIEDRMAMLNKTTLDGFVGLANTAGIFATKLMYEAVTLGQKSNTLENSIEQIKGKPTTASDAMKRALGLPQRLNPANW